MAYTHRRLDVNVPHALVVDYTLLPTDHRWDKATSTCFYDERAKKHIASRYGFPTVPSLPPFEYPRARVDWRLGPHEPMQYPQMWDHSAPHLAWIEYSPSHTDLYSQPITGYVFQKTDWEPIHAHSEYGRVSTPVLSRLREAFHAIHKLVLPLFAEARTKHLLPKRTISECMALLSEFQTVAAAFKASALNVTRVQRGIAELRGFYRFRMDCRYHVQNGYFVSEVINHYVGVYTTDRHISSLLHRLGVPVFLVFDAIPKGVSIEVLSQPPTSWGLWVETRLLDAVHLPPETDSSRSLTNIGKRVKQFNTDPQMQVGRAKVQVEMAEWVPDALPWLADICATVDTSEDRQRRLCAPDVEYPVPQSFFTQGSLYIMPPVHLFYKKNPKASEIVFTCWGSIDTFWTSRVSGDDPTLGNGLSAPTWRTFLDMKYKPRDIPANVTVATTEDSENANTTATSNEAGVDRTTSRWGHLGKATRVSKPAVSESESSLEHRASQLEDETYRALLIAAHESDDESDDDEPAMYNANELRIYYTRPAARDERPLLSEEQRHTARPPNWDVTRLEYYVEEDSRRMTKASENRKGLVRFSNCWDRFDDYENKRRLFFMRSSRVASEFPEGGERRIAEGVLTWHRDREDNVGRAHPSQYIWPFERPQAELRSHERALEHAPYLLTPDQAIADGIPVELIGKSMREIEREMINRALWTKETMWPSARKEIAVPMHPAPTATVARPEPVTATQREPDPIYGTHAPLPYGRAVSEFRFGTHVVTAEDLKKVEYRKFILWRIQEATFRFQLRRLDMYVLKAMGVWDDVAGDRATLWLKCWGRGSESFVPGGDVEPLLSRENPMDRFLGLTALSKIVHSWPRSESFRSMHEYLHRPLGLYEAQVPIVERDLWRLYAQTHFDYFGLMPTLPAKMPPNPFSSALSE
ncbi:hypothetical protein EXIGLDRAFT_763677 [Exidia glandulosa HHB12029]|uniref:Uncharacterized protein n=1 Tax=Exidia glandulosa HHB12029 TaxID=1314781 RepID=A0A165LQL0_EXIGL|nr:hypothetical protein EXIGLDRAFT_763677 [Exidia glandulosa HHB12029]